MSNFWWLSLTFSCGNPRYLHWKVALLELYIKPVPVANFFSLDSSSRKSHKPLKMQKMKFLLAIFITLGLEFCVKAKALQIYNPPLYQKHLESGNFWKSHSNRVYFSFTRTALRFSFPDFTPSSDASWCLTDSQHWEIQVKTWVFI